MTFFDFGMVKRFSPADTGVFRQMIQALVTDDDIAGFRRVVEEAGILPGAHNLSDRAVADCLGVFTRLMVEDGHFRVDGAFATELVRRTFATKGTHGAVIKAANLPAPFVVLQRINLGLVALPGHLQASAPWRAIAEECWPWVQGQPATDMGRAEAAWLGAVPYPGAVSYQEAA